MPGPGGPGGGPGGMGGPGFGGPHGGPGGPPPPPPHRGWRRGYGYRGPGCGGCLFSFLFIIGIGAVGISGIAHGIALLLA